MSYLNLFTFFLIFLKIYSTSGNSVNENDISSLYIGDVDNIMNNEEYTFLVVYTHWCHLSQLLLNDLKKMIKLLEYDKVNINKINIAVNSSVIERLNVYNYPSIFMLKKNNINKYTNSRSIKGIVSWIYTFLDESVYEILNVKKLNAYLELEEYNNSVLFIIAKNNPDDKLIKELIELCLLANYTFCFYIKQKHIIDYFENTIMKEKYNIYDNKQQNNDIYIVLFKNDEFGEYFYYFEEITNQLYNPSYPKNEKFNELIKKISEKIEPLVIKFSEVYYSLLFLGGTVTLFIIYNDINQLNKLEITNSAKKHNGIVFAISGINEVFEKRLMSDLLIDDVKKPVMRIIKFIKGISIPYKYKPINDDIEINEKTIDEFIAGSKTNDKYFYRKSERPLPDEFNNGYVKIIVADTYNEYVFDKNKHVVVLYYAPWCGHCHKLEPIYRDLGKRLKLYSSKYKDYNDDIVICKFDAVNNEIYNISINEYPTIYLYTKSKKSTPIKYLGLRYVKEIAIWIFKHTGANINISKLLSLNLDEEQLFENYEEL